MKFHKLQKIAFILFFTLIVASLIIYKVVAKGLSLEDFQITIKDLGLWAPIVFVCLYAMAVIFIPSTPFMILLGLLFGFKEGLIYAIIGGLLSSLIVFTISRRLGKEWVESILHHRYLKKIDDYNKRLESGGVLDLIILRILPIMPFNILNILMGISKIKTKNYMVATLLGLVPSNMVSVYFGNLLAKLF